MNDLLSQIVRRALREDIGTGDVTTLASVPEELRATAVFLAKQEGILCGLEVAKEVFLQTDSDAEVQAYLRNGDRFETGQELAKMAGRARGLLMGERVALNFLQRLSGIATLTRRFVEAVAGTRARIVDTRKTTPGLRVLERAAVRAGGGLNNRMGLYDAAMVKDNHILAAGGIARAVEKVRAAIPHTMTITVECENLDQVRQALDAGANTLLLDNMRLEALAEAVRLASGRALTEASGGVSLETVASIAATGVDLISVGALTHSAPSIDISLDFVS